MLLLLCSFEKCSDIQISDMLDASIQMGSNLVGWAVGGGAVASTALYQIWAGTKQKELGAGSMQVSGIPAAGLPASASNNTRLSS